MTATFSPLGPQFVYVQTNITELFHKPVFLSPYLTKELFDVSHMVEETLWQEGLGFLI